MSLPNFVFHNGRVVPYSDVKFGVLTHALNYGTAVFGGLRAYWNEDEKQLFVFRPYDHFRRFLQSAQLLCMNLRTSREDLTNQNDLKIQADSKLKYTFVMEIMDICMKAGFRNVGFSPPPDLASAGR